MLSDEEKKEYEELKSLLYTGTISQYGKRKLIDIIEKQSKEIEELKENNKNLEDELNKYIVKLSDEQYRRLVNIIRDEINKLWEDKIKAKTIEIKNRQVKDEFITASQGKLDTIIEIESLLERK